MSPIAPVLPDQVTGSDFSELLRQYGVVSGLRCLLIIDAAQLEENEALRSLYTHCDNPVWCWLFDDSALAPHAEVGPIVVETTINSDFCRQAIAAWADKGLVFIVSEQPTDVLLAGLRKMLWVELETFGPTILRPYDSRFLQVIKSCQPKRLATFSEAECLWLWSIDMPAKQHWTEFQFMSTEPVSQSHGNRDFERMLGWIAGWRNCAQVLKTAGAQDADDVSQFIAIQYRAGKDMPDDISSLKAEWEEHHQLHG